MSPETAQIGLTWWQWIIAGLFPLSSIVSLVIGFVRGSRALDQVIQAKNAQIDQLNSALEDERRHSAREVRAEVLAFKDMYREAKEEYDKAKNELERAKAEKETLAAKVTDLQEMISQVKTAAPEGDRAGNALDEVLDLASAVGYSGATVVNSVTSIMDSTRAGEKIVAAAWQKLSPEEWQRRADRYRTTGRWEDPDDPAPPAGTGS